MPFSLLGLLFTDYLIYPQELLAEKCLMHIRIGSLLWIVSLIAFYLIHLKGMKSFDQERKLLWAVVLLVGNVFSMPVYWYRYIWQVQHQKTFFQNDDGSQIIGF